MSPMWWGITITIALIAFVTGVGLSANAGHKSTFESVTPLGRMYPRGRRKDMGTKNQPGKFDCYENALPDEPMFVLLGRDRNAPELVRRWARLREQAMDAGVLPKSDLAAISEATACAAQMEKWREENDGAWRPKSTARYELTWSDGFVERFPSCDAIATSKIVDGHVLHLVSFRWLP